MNPLINMIVTENKPLQDILNSLIKYKNIFLIGCGECATACKTGGNDELDAMQKDLEKNGKIVVGKAIPEAPCLAAKLKKELTQYTQKLKSADAVLVLACGLGVQSARDNARIEIPFFPALNSLFGATMDNKGNLYERCSLCGECMLDKTATLCPITLCPKSLLNGPCSGVNQGKCEIDKEIDCVWVLIYQELAKRGELNKFREIQKPKNFKKIAKPRRQIIS